MVVLGKNCLYSGKSGCIRAKLVVFRQKWFCLDNVVVFEKMALVGQKWLYSGKVVVIGQNCFIFCAKVVVFGQHGFIRAKVVVIWQKWLCSNKIYCFRAK